MFLYRPVGLNELELIYDLNFEAFPPRLPEQPIFYPVLNFEYAEQIACNWNTKSNSFAGFVTKFEVNDNYIEAFEPQTVGGVNHQELWIPAEELEVFNSQILGKITIESAYFGEKFIGYIPNQFGLKDKNIDEQFLMLYQAIDYNRFDFYNEILANRKAVFLNYRYWMHKDFSNSGLSEKQKVETLESIKEIWEKNFPEIKLI